MAIGDYQFILFPMGNVPNFSEDGIEFVGQNKFSLYQAVDVLEKSAHIKNDSTLKSWNSFDDECYFLYYDGKYKVEIELNTGRVTEEAEDISIRTNIYRDEGSVIEALRICQVLCDSLNLKCWNMKLREIIDLHNASSVADTINHYRKLRNKS
ncbi:hypothetical protein M5X11_37705 [Paenibacillus alginolyticus]|uniref:hypothetical protein n=1 Tax=Paenibacillus alginolyticus TaxID=59839 RepID=UPI00049280DA|nr:hypothetical protein [Paenibacillus alginolyticus]MCY9670560.1 hypothetical protein [Paenibacillus alginolyticus]